MNIYVIYKFDDYKVVRETIAQIQQVISANHRIFMFEPKRKPKFWHHHAKKKLKESQMVILFDSLSGDEAKVGKHISWELKKAEKYGKRIVVFKTDPDSQNRSWYEYDYSEQNPRHSRHKTVAIEDAVAFMEKECGWQVDGNLLHKAVNTEPLTDGEMQLLLEQYRIMIDTSEKLMERRQETVNLYMTLCTTLIAFVGTSLAFDNLNITMTLLFSVGLMLAVLCRNWRLSLNSYDLTNTGKFMVINLLEKYLPAEIFECEYRYNKQNGIRSFSSREKLLPFIFSILGYLLMGISAIHFAWMLLQESGII